MPGGIKVQMGIRRRYTRAPVHRPGAAHVQRQLAQAHVAPDINHGLPHEDDASLPFLPQDDHAEFGDEGFDFSHAGGEYEVFSNIMHELGKAGIGLRDHRTDTRDRRDRTLQRVAAWAVQVDHLTDAYLHWKSGRPAPRFPVDVETSWDIPSIDLFSRKSLTIYSHRDSVYKNVALVHNGAIGCAPRVPSICLTLRTLEDYRQGHRVNPRMTIQAQVRKMCALHNVPFHHYLVTQFSIAYDVYLAIIREVDKRVNRALGRASANWRALNSCPACEYKLVNEPPLQFSKLVAIDGNNSLRRVDPTQTKSTLPLEDSRLHTSDIWLTPAQVNQYKDEVKAQRRSQPTQSQRRPNPSHHQEDESEELDDGDVTAGAPEVTVCIERWRAAGPDERKRMWKMFAETGIFIAVCRHGFLLFVCDMIQSGELAKYPLALVNKLLDVYGADLAVGYDIGCAFSQTISKSQQLAPKANHGNLRMLVPSFHGHAHNRGCQLRWHPMYIPGTGLEDFETCERVFSLSNALAAGTRHASAFHRIQAIEEYFKFWDEDKYASLVQFISNNYRQALEIISTERPLLSNYSTTMGFVHATYEGFLQQEREYLTSLTEPRVIDPLDSEYVSLLQTFEDFSLVYSRALEEWESQDRVLQQYPPTEHRRVLAQLLHNLQVTSKRHEFLNTQLHKVEAQMGMTEGERWKLDHPRRMAVVDDINCRAYNESVDNLERLVVMRLFELTKLNQSGTAYKMRRQIQKQLQVRSRAIRTAIARYNQLAGKMVPPRETLDVAKVLDYAFIGEFELLRFSRQDVRNQLWAQPGNREAMQRYFRIKAAEEEIRRLNVEIQRIVTFISDESQFIPQKLTELSIANLSLAYEIEWRWNLRRAVNQSHIIALTKLTKRTGFSGTIQPGQRIVANDSSGEILDNTQPLTVLGSQNEGMMNDPVAEGESGDLSEDDELVNLAFDLQNWHDNIE